MREKREKVSGSIKEINEVFSCVFLILSTGGVLSYGGWGRRVLVFSFFPLLNQIKSLQWGRWTLAWCCFCCVVLLRVCEIETFPKKVVLRKKKREVEL